MTIPASLMEIIELRSPQPGATVNLSSDAFRWTDIPGAKQYEVQFAVLMTTPGGGTTMSGGPHLRMEQSHLRLSEANVPKRAKQQLAKGSSATWRVNAYDINGRQIGVSAESARTFVVAGELR